MRYVLCAGRIYARFKPYVTTHPTAWRSILILSTHLHLGLPSGLPTSGFPTKTLYTPFSSPICATCPTYLILLDFITSTILGEEYKSFSSSLVSVHVPTQKTVWMTGVKKALIWWMYNLCIKPMNGFGWNLFLGSFGGVCQHISILSWNQTTVRDILLEDCTCVSVHMLNILINWPVFIRKKIFQTEVAEKNEPRF